MASLTSPSEPPPAVSNCGVDCPTEWLEELNMERNGPDPSGSVLWAWTHDSAGELRQVRLDGLADPETVAMAFAELGVNVTIETSTRTTYRTG